MAKFIDVIVTIDGFQHGEDEFTLKAMAVVASAVSFQWSNLYHTAFLAYFILLNNHERFFIFSRYVLTWLHFRTCLLLHLNPRGHYISACSVYVAVQAQNKIKYKIHTTTKTRNKKRNPLIRLLRCAFLVPC